MNREDWTLLVLAAANEQGLSPVQLQKSLFLLGKNLKADMLGDDFYQFEPYNYGPFDATVYRDAEELADHGLATISRTRGRRWPMYQITPTGKAAAQAVREKVAGIALRYLNNVVAWTQNLTFRQLVSAIYARYPEMREQSVFQG